MTLAMLLAGILFTCFGVKMYTAAAGKKKRCSLKCTAEVTGYVTKARVEGREKQKTYFPVVRYSVGGTAYEETSAVGAGGPRYREGSKTVLFCDPENPQEFYLDKDFGTESIPLIILFMGVCLLIGGLVRCFM